MKIRIDGEEVKLHIGEWIQTTHPYYGQIVYFDEIYDKITIVGKYDNCKVSVNRNEVCGVGEMEEDIMITFLDENPPEKAMKEYSKDGIEKPRLSLIPQNAIVEVAKVLGDKSIFVRKKLDMGVQYALNRRIRFVQDGKKR